MLPTLRQLSPLCLLPLPSLPQFVLLHLFFPLSHHRVQLHHYARAGQRFANRAADPRRRHRRHHHHRAQHALLHGRHARRRRRVHCSVSAGPADRVPRCRPGNTQPPRSQCPS